MDHDEFIDELQRNIPQEWEASEGSAESIVLDYVRALEKRVVALGGHLGAYDGGQTAALGEFYSLAREHAVTRDGWGRLADAWQRACRIKIKADAE